MFSLGDGKQLSAAAGSAVSAACSTLAVWRETEKAVSPIRRRVRGTTRSPDRNVRRIFTIRYEILFQRALESRHKSA